MFDVVAIGEILIDFKTSLVDENGYPTLSAHPGGAPANFLSALSRFGRKTALISKVGDDSFGRLLLNTLKAGNINVDNVKISPDVFTTLAFVTLDEKNDREFSFARKPGADTCIEVGEIDFDVIDKTQVVHFGTLSMTDEPSRTATRTVVEYAKKKGKLITFDPNLRRPLWSDLSKAKEAMLWGLSVCDIIKISSDEVEFLFGTDVENGAKIMLSDYNPKLVFITMGEKGCYFMNENSCGYVDGLSGLRVVDTVGAGDIFGASALFKVLEYNVPIDELTEKELYEISAFAVTASGLSVTRDGGITSIPSLDEVYEKLKELI